MITPNLTGQADVALDPMAGTLQTGRIAYSPDFQSEQRNIHGSIQAADTYARAPAPCLLCMGTGGEEPGTECPICRAQSGAQSSTITPETRASTGCGVAPEPGVNVCILALDLGTKLGWAVRTRDGRFVHGTEAFTPRKSWTPGQRWLRARSFLAELIVRHQVHAIAYEDVKRHAGTDAAHAYGAFLCLVQMAADSHRTALLPVGVGTIKKHWTGKGNADKDAMKAQARARGFTVVDDNNADALAILHWAVYLERRA